MRHFRSHKGVIKHFIRKYYQLVIATAPLCRRTILSRRPFHPRPYNSANYTINAASLRNSNGERHISETRRSDNCVLQMNGDTKVSLSNVLDLKVKVAKNLPHVLAIVTAGPPMHKALEFVSVWRHRSQSLLKGKVEIPECCWSGGNCSCPVVHVSQ